MPEYKEILDRVVGEPNEAPYPPINVSLWRWTSWPWLSASRSSRLFHIVSRPKSTPASGFDTDVPCQSQIVNRTL